LVSEQLGWEAIMTTPSTVSEINGMITELAYKYAKLAENDPKAEHIKNELSRLTSCAISYSKRRLR
jgi:hypothetical protein